MTDAPGLADRVRALLADERPVREVSMFGGQCFMVREKMVVGVMRDGELLVRVPRERDDDLMTEPGASRPEMGAGRSMGPGWIQVTAGALTSDGRLHFWVGTALRQNRSLTGTPD